MDADGLDLLLKEEPGSPAGMDLDALLMPQVLDRCGVCHQLCPPEEAKSLATCLRCSSKVHGRCDRRAADALKAATYLAIKNEPEGAAGQQQQQLVLHGQQQQQAAAGYLCPTCVQQAADACPLDLLQLHAALLADIKPRRPRSAADIHAAELTRKHLAAGGRLDMTLLQGLIGHAWAHEGHKGRYDALADKEDAAYQASLATYDGLYQQYASLATSMGQEADISLSLDPQQQLAEMRAALTAAAAAGGGGGGGGRGGRVSAGGGDAPYMPGGSAPGGRGGRVARVNLAVGDVTYLLGSGGTVTARDGSEVPQMINVTCNGTRGVFHLGDMKINCHCPSCAHAPAGKRIFTPTQFEQHGGCGTAKKWRISIRIEPGAVPEVARYANAMTFGRWMEMKGIEAKGQRTPASTTGMLNAYADGPHPAGRYGSIKSEREWSYDRGGSPTSSGRGEEGAGAVRPASAASILPRNRRPESWAPWEDVKLGNYKPVQVRWAGDRCCVCDSDVDYDCDQLVSCEGCGVTVHQSCYGVPELPDEDDMWLCRSCELKEPGAPEPQCCLCPLTGGGLKPTTLKGMWAHAACMQWIPEVTCLEPLRMEPIDRIQYIQKERWELLCVICRQRMGAKIQCHECYQAYHPLCARRAGLHMEMAESAVPNGPLQLITYCPKHCKARVGASGITLVNEEEAPRIGRPRKAGDAAAAAADAAANNSASGLLNAQPFRPNKPAAPVPAAPGGCARASPLSPDDTQRVSHGTGTGATTVAGFWIPTTQSAAAAAAAAAARRGWGAGGGWDVLEDDAPGGRGRKRGRPPGRPPRPAKPPVYRGGGLPPADQPPPEVELLPLPAGCPDRVQVQCNSRRGVFIVRSQKVEDGTRGGTELTPSRFEAVAGKAEAKKWRSSLWAVGEDGSPDCQMGDWLARFKLDKAALAKLTANFNAWQLRQLWEAEYTGEGAAARAAARAAAGAGAGVEGGDAAEPTGTEGGTDAGGGTEGGDEDEEEEEEEVQQAPPSKRQQRRQSSGRQGSERPAGTEEDDGEEEGSEQQQGSTGKAAAGEDDAAGPASKKQKRGSSADANGNSPAAAAAAAADDAKQQEGGEAADAGAHAQAGSGSARSTPVTKLKRLHLLHLPLGFRVHPAAMPPRAAAAAAARQKQLLQQQQEKAAADAAAAAEAAGEGPAAAAGSSPAAAPSAAAGPSSSTVTDPLMAAVLAPKTADSAVSAVRNPWLCVGQCCRVYWVDDDEWYDADVTAYDPASKKHTLWYHADEIREAIDLRVEEQQGRLQWLPLVDKSQWPAPPLRHFGGRPQQQQPQQQGAAAAGAGAGAAGGQQQQQQGPPPEPIPPGFPRLTAMHRDPSPAGGDSERADLVGLSARRAPLSQQLQAMLMLQQENHKRFSTQQPPRHLIPTGQAAVGWRVGLFRPEVGVYYYGMVASHEAGQQLHMVDFDDGAVEVVPLQKQRIDWVSERGADISAAAQALHRAYLQSRGEVPPLAAAAAGTAAAAAAAAAAGAGGQLLPGAAVPDGGGGQLLSAGAGGGGQQQPQQLSGPPPDAPKQVDVICGPNQAVFDCVRMAVLTSEGLLISPTEFERQSGKGCSKKWKATIRVRKANGFPGMTMGDWLLQMGYEQPRAGGAEGTAAGPGGRGSSLNDIRRRQFSRRAMGPAGGGSAGVPDRDDKPYQPKGTAPNRGTTSHRPNCMCVICKQARRKAAQAAGLPYVEDGSALLAAAPEAAAPPVALAPAGKGGGSAAAAAAAGGGFKVPAWLIGKRAYVRAVPHLVHGAMRHDPWEVPESTCYTAAEWEAAQATEDPSSTQAAAAAGAGSSRPGTPALSAGAGPDTSRASTPVLGDAAAPAAAAGGGAAAAGVDGDATLTDAAAAAAGAEGDQQQQGAAAAGTAAAAAAAPPGQQQQQLAVKGSRSTTWRSKLRVCQTLEPRRITFGKSGIHGWGIFARRLIPADTMVTEFRGQLIRGILADVREAEYRKQHRDCYMFHATAGTVIDNTERGNTSRFTNHCCSPCLYVKVLELQGELHLCFFAKRDIAAGQELTFDYRFKEEDSDSKVLCQCAAPNCKGTLN